MNQIVTESVEAPAQCSVCGGKFGPVRLPRQGVAGKAVPLMLSGRLDIICQDCDVWLFSLVYNGQIGKMSDWDFKELQ